jgi:arginine/lysine/ornithine decarboxylase
VFLRPTRNHYGIIGPIPQSEFMPEAIKAKIAGHPLLQGVTTTQKPRILTITQSTYDGVLYNTETIKHALDGYINTLHFDEAWLPHAAFHKFYGTFHAMGKNRPRPKDQIVFATQSTHKLLAGISQASQVLVQDSQTRKLDPHLFNEAYLMHSSTSPQYAIIASCDVSAAMMEAPGGRALVEESIAESLDFRRAMRKVDTDFGKDWWFRVWGPEKLANEGIGSSADWMLKNNAKWHGFGAIADGFNLLDPIKCTIITPGLDVSGKFAKTGIPAAVVTKFLVDHGVVVEKTGLYSFFIMFTIGITKGRWNTLVTALQQFKDDFDRNQPCWKVMPEFTAAHPHYERIGLRDLSQSIHDFYAKDDIARLVTDMYVSDIQPVMKPSDAFACIAHGQTERVEIDHLEGRLSTTLLTPYPPGIPLLIPGERFNRKIVDYLRFTRSFNKAFPGFDTDVHGLMSMKELQGVAIEGDKYYVDCVK